jgi:Uma2 family endonuclease
MSDVATCKRMSPNEYLAFERAAEQKHEYADGEIFAISGGTFEHSLVAANLLRELGVSLAGRPCWPLTSDMRVKVEGSSRYLYPDGSVVCGEPLFEDARRDTLLNPKVVIEVLSESSEAYDRGDKFACYRTIPSLAEYLLASQTEPRLDHYVRQPDDGWLLRSVGPGGRVRLPSLGCELAVDRIYADVFTTDRRDAGA